MVVRGMTGRSLSALVVKRLMVRLLLTPRHNKKGNAMSGYHVHVVTDKAGRECAVICEGSVVYHGPNPTGRELFDILQSVNGWEYIQHHEVASIPSDPMKVPYPD